MSLVKIPVPWRGMDLSNEPDTLAAGEGTLLRNVIPGRSGSLMVRSGMSRAAILPLSNKSGLGEGMGGFWVAPDSVADKYLVQANSGFVSNSGAAAFALPAGVTNICASHARLNGYTVGVVSTGRLMTWDGSAVLVHNSAGPSSVVAVASHIMRVFTITSSGKLNWTDPNPDLPSNLAGAWQDDVSGLTNLIQFPGGEVYYDLAVYNRVLYVFTSRSVYALVGDTPSSFVVRKVLELGAADSAAPGLPGHTTTTQRGLYFFSEDGIARYDGATSEVVSKPVAHLISPVSWIHLEAVGDGFVSVCTSDYWLIYHEPSESWTTFTVDAALMPPTSNAPNGVGGIPAHVRRLGTSVYAFRPSDSGVAGTAVQCSDVWIDTPGRTGSDNVGGVLKPIDAQAVSASVRLTTPDRKAALRRLFAQAAYGTWTVQIEDEAGNAIGPPAQTSGGAVRGRAESDIFQEYDIIRVRWRLDSYPAGVLSALASVGDAYVKVDTAQQR